MLWIVRMGSLWRDLPVVFGNWSSIFRHFNDWRAADVLNTDFRYFVRWVDPDMEYAMADETIVKVHRYGQDVEGRLRGNPQAARRTA
ncbi:transposase [Acetobacter oeni]|uniref:Insertion element IS402-like domain-containing protein n=1 Tax=Acetobacter oeni TaxID=304077 RepID=A0A511XJ22_9PROT|nr:transposase [Acetobacter oeni]MBB3882693.1 transposase [Acetobacter oeni]GBR07457.1 transposase [Acetobacter oeni LMG 21952]GEN62947.1 hypothetical protein AOE01nite_11710 [Acetobacter oeni]